MLMVTIIKFIMLIDDINELNDVYVGEVGLWLLALFYAVVRVRVFVL